MKIKVSREDLYRYCSDFGLMLSWGIPVVKVLTELEKCQNNQFLKDFTLCLSEKIMSGNRVGDFFREFPEVFKTVFIKWERIGEKFGNLDEVLLQMAGLYRMDYLLLRANGDVPAEPLGTFLTNLSEALKDSGTEKTQEKKSPLYSCPIILNGKISTVKIGEKSLMDLTDNQIIHEWIERVSVISEEGSLFGNSTMNYHLEPVYRKIANPLFWHILDGAETRGYLPSMLEILGLYLVDKNNLLPGDKPVEIQSKLFSGKDTSCVKQLLDLIEGSRDKKLSIARKKEGISVMIDGNEKDLTQLLALPTGDAGKVTSVINSLKLFFDLDPVEKCLPQKVKTEMTFNNIEYSVSVNITPPYPLTGTKLNINEASSLEREERLEIEFKRV